MINKIINSEGQQYEPETISELVFDAKPIVNSFNAITSDAVARAVAGASGEVPQVTSDDNGKVLKAIYDEGGAAVEWGPEPTVDQTYDATSENAQSGTAVAEALGTETTLVAGSGISLTESSGSLTIAATNVPAVTSNDNEKVLTASYDSDTGTGSVSWAAPSGGTPTFTRKIATLESGTFIAQEATALEPGLYLVRVTIMPSEWRDSYYLMLGVTMSDRYPRMSGEYFSCPFNSSLQSNRAYSVVTTINVTTSEAYGFALQYASLNTSAVTPANNDTVEISYVKIANTLG